VIGILYSCSMCGLKDAEVRVRFRSTNENVIEWMKGIVEPSLGADHAARSPDCHPKELQNVKIPVPPGTQEVGGPVQQ